MSAVRSTLLRQSALLAKAATPSVRIAATPMRALAAKPMMPTTTMMNTSRIAAFHASSRRDLLPPGPQVIEGTVNDAEPIPHSDPSHGSYHWTFERLLAAGLVPLAVTPFASGSLNPTMDAVLCAAVLVHSHLGFQVILVDYVNTWRYPKSRKVLTWVLNGATALVGLGLYEFETNDVGLTELITRVWKA